MTQIVTFDDFTPPIRFDAVPWTDAQVEEGLVSAGPWTVIDSLPLSPPDPDPSQPLSRSFTTSLGTAPYLWYRITFFDAGGSTSVPTLPIRNIQGRAPYASVEELALLLRVKVADRGVALMRVLEAAAFEIDAELGRTVDLADPELHLVAEVNLERAVEHWQQMQSPFGIVGLGDAVATYTARDSWDRHAHKLSPLKQTWGLA